MSWPRAARVGRRAFAALTTTILLGSCQPGTGMVVTQLLDGRIVISAWYLNGGKFCIGSVGIGKDGIPSASGQFPPYRFEMYWSIGLKQRSGPCLSTIVYPEVPVGFELGTNIYEDRVPRELVPGQKYEVVVDEVVVGMNERSFVRIEPRTD